MNRFQTAGVLWLVAAILGAAVSVAYRTEMTMDTSWYAITLVGERYRCGPRYLAALATEQRDCAPIHDRRGRMGLDVRRAHPDPVRRSRSVDDRRGHWGYRRCGRGGRLQRGSRARRRGQVRPIRPKSISPDSASSPAPTRKPSWADARPSWTVPRLFEVGGATTPVDLGELLVSPALAEPDRQVDHRRGLVLACPGDRLGMLASTGMWSPRGVRPASDAGVVGRRPERPAVREESRTSSAARSRFAGSVVRSRHRYLPAGQLGGA